MGFFHNISEFAGREDFEASGVNEEQALTVIPFSYLYLCFVSEISCNQFEK